MKDGQLSQLENAHAIISEYNQDVLDGTVQFAMVTQRFVDETDMDAEALSDSGVYILKDQKDVSIFAWRLSTDDGNLKCATNHPITEQDMPTILPIIRNLVALAYMTWLQEEREWETFEQDTTPLAGRRAQA